MFDKKMITSVYKLQGCNESVMKDELLNLF